ncbi:MAG: cytochrome b/b6 domain-containing protein [Massilia sp.]
MSTKPYLDERAPSRSRRRAPSQPAANDAGQPPLRIQVWDLPIRVFHWSLVVAVSTAVVTGLIGGDLMPVHGKAGLAIVGLVSFRLVWGLIGSTHARFANFVPTPRRVLAYLQGRWRGHGHNPLGALSVLALLGLLALQAGTGLFSNDEIAFAGPLSTLVSDERSLSLTGWHQLAAKLLYCLMALHVAAILVYQFFKRHKLIEPMVTGWKDVDEGSSARAGSWPALLIAVATAVAVVFVVSGARAASAPQAPAAAPVQHQAAPAAKVQPQAAPSW